MALVEFIAGLILCSDSPGSYTVFSRLQTHRLYLQWLIGNPLQLAYAATSGQQTVNRFVLHSLPWCQRFSLYFCYLFQEHEWYTLCRLFGIWWLLAWLMLQ